MQQTQLPGTKGIARKKLDIIVENASIVTKRSKGFLSIRRPPLTIVSTGLDPRRSIASSELNVANPSSSTENALRRDYF